MDSASSRTVVRTAKYSTLPRRFVGRLVETGRLLLHFLQPVDLRLHIDAEGLQGGGQLPAPGQGHADNLRPVQSLDRVRMFDRPGADTALSRWLVQRKVGVTSLGQNHHLVQMKVDLAGQLQANEPGSLTLQRDLQRLLIGLAAKTTAVVRVREPEVLAIARKQHLDMCGARLEPVTPVVESKSAQRGRIAKINLPPRVLFQLSVESPFAIDDSVAAADRIVLGCDLVGSGLQPRRNASGLGSANPLPAESV